MAIIGHKVIKKDNLLEQKRLRSTLQRLCIGLGGLLIVSSLVGEFVFASDISVGLGPAQQYLILVGILLIILGFVGEKWLRWLHNQVGNVLLGVAAVGLGLVGVEMGLAVLGYAPIYSTQPVPEYREAICNDWGCQWHRECIFEDEAYCRAYNYISDRWFSFIGQSGVTYFSETEADSYYKILVLGDSFTYGETSDVGQSWVEQIAVNFSDKPNVVMWNTGFSATGTNRSLKVVETYLPLVHPNLMVLGFFPANDFYDNLLPVGARAIVVDERGRGIAVATQAWDAELGAYVQRSPEAIYYSARGLSQPPMGLETLIYGTRVGSFIAGLNRMRHGISDVLVPVKTVSDAEKYAITDKIVADMQAMGLQYEASLLVVLIPSQLDLSGVSADYQQARDMFARYNIPIVDPVAVLTGTDYARDGHWNNAGHHKVGALAVPCIISLMNGQKVCPPVAN